MKSIIKKQLAKTTHVSSIEELDNYFSTQDVENCNYFRITNLSTDQDMKVAFVTAATNYQVTVRAGGSHVLYQAEAGILGEADSTPAFSGLADIVTVQVRPSASTDVQVEVFAALV